MYRLSTDVGGTFTDGVLLDEQTGRVRVTKVSSTPRNPAIGTIEVIVDLLEQDIAYGCSQTSSEAVSGGGEGVKGSGFGSGSRSIQSRPSSVEEL